MAFKAKIRKIGTSLGIILPKEKLNELNLKEGDIIIIRRIERPVMEVRGILKGWKFEFVRETEDRDEDLDEAFGKSTAS